VWERGTGKYARVNQCTQNGIAAHTTKTPDICRGQFKIKLSFGKKIGLHKNL